MSYRFDMAFASCETWGNALEIGAILADELTKTDNAKRLLKENAVYLPSARFQDGATGYADENWIANLFTLHFIYWPAKKLLGLVGGILPGTETIFKKSVFFQNSCDQDYDFDEWSGICPAIDDIVSDWRMMSDDKIKAKAVESGYDEEDIKERGYFERAMVYQAVFDSLELDAWLDEEESPSFKRFSMCGVHQMWKRNDLVTMAKKICKFGSKE